MSIQLVEYTEGSFIITLETDELYNEGLIEKLKKYTTRIDSYIITTPTKVIINGEIVEQYIKEPRVYLLSNETLIDSGKNCNDNTIINTLKRAKKLFNNIKYSSRQKLLLGQKNNDFYVYYDSCINFRDVYEKVVSFINFTFKSVNSISFAYNNDDELFYINNKAITELDKTFVIFMGEKIALSTGTKEIAQDIIDTFS
jgi:hypothetical protein